MKEKYKDGLIKNIKQLRFPLDIMFNFTINRISLKTQDFKIKL